MNVREMLQTGIIVLPHNRSRGNHNKLLIGQTWCQSRSMARCIGFQNQNRNNRSSGKPNPLLIGQTWRRSRLTARRIGSQYTERHNHSRGNLRHRLSALPPANAIPIFAEGFHHDQPARSCCGGASDNCLKLARLHEPCADRETHVRMYARGR